MAFYPTFCYMLRILKESRLLNFPKLEKWLKEPGLGEGLQRTIGFCHHFPFKAKDMGWFFPSTSILTALEPGEGLWYVRDCRHPRATRWGVRRPQAQCHDHPCLLVRGQVRAVCGRDRGREVRWDRGSCEVGGEEGPGVNFSLKGRLSSWEPTSSSIPVRLKRRLVHVKVCQIRIEKRKQRRHLKDSWRASVVFWWESLNLSWKSRVVDYSWWVLKI